MPFGLHIFHCFFIVSLVNTQLLLRAHVAVCKRHEGAVALLLTFQDGSVAAFYSCLATPVAHPKLTFSAECDARQGVLRAGFGWG